MIGTSTMETLLTFAKRYGVQLRVTGSIGFGRDCVGFIDATGSTYISVQSAGRVTRPERAYHKGPYMAVLCSHDHVSSTLHALDELARWAQDLMDAGARLDDSYVNGWSGEIEPSVRFYDSQEMFMLGMN